MAALASGAIDYLLDVNTAIEDPLNHGLWLTSGGALTLDGRHCNSAGHALLVPLVTLLLSSLSMVGAIVTLN